MPDPRLQKLARVLIHYSLCIEPGQRFVIRASPGAMPLVREVYREAIRAGAYVDTLFMLDELDEIFFREGSDDQLTHISDFSRIRAEQYDADLRIEADENTKTLSSVDPKRLALWSKAHESLSARRMERAAKGELHWCVTLFPTNALAQEAGMSLSEYEEFVYDALLLNLDDPIEGWRKVAADQQRVVDFLNQHDEIHIVAPGTDLTYRVGGRTWISAMGDANLPDGEVFTGPIEDSVNGTVHFSYPTNRAGKEIGDLTLTFRDGKVVEATASRGQEALIATLDTDAGARYLGEVAFGLNYNIKRFTHNTLFDEKIGGTMHMALGRSYPETGGKNESAIHWDIVTDLHEGKVYADGQLCYEAGHFRI
jgi:aminopeptidase